MTQSSADKNLKISLAYQIAVLIKFELFTINI